MIRAPAQFCQCREKSDGFAKKPSVFFRRLDFARKTTKGLKGYGPGLKVDSLNKTVGTSVGALPISPVMDPRWMEARTRYRSPKAIRPGNNVPAGRFRRKLRSNPYAQALCQPIRYCPISQTYLPKYFLQELKLVAHPETKALWWTPRDLDVMYAANEGERGAEPDADADGRDPPEPSAPAWPPVAQQKATERLMSRLGTGYALASKALFKSISGTKKTTPHGEKWKTLLVTKRGGPALDGPQVWREDMDDFILDNMRRNVMKHLINLAELRTGRDRRSYILRLGSWEKAAAIPQRGCLLWYSSVNGLESGVSGPGGEARSLEPFAMYDVPEAKYEGRLPVYDLRRLLGEAYLARLREIPMFRGSSLFILRKQRSIPVQLHLWKLQAYMGKEPIDRPESASAKGSTPPSDPSLLDGSDATHSSDSSRGKGPTVSVPQGLPDRKPTRKPISEREAKHSSGSSRDKGPTVSVPQGLPDRKPTRKPIKLVDEKEKACAFGQLQLQHLEAIFKNEAVRKCIEGIEDWEDNLETLKAFQDERQILIGVWGETGLGKSSLINALLGYKIVPTSQSSACTAAVCVFGYNNDTAGGNQFRATITFKSWETVKTELDALKREQAELEEMRGHFESDPTSDFSGQYAEVERSIQSIMSWSGLSEAFIRKSSPEQILENAGLLAADMFAKVKADIEADKKCGKKGGKKAGKTAGKTADITKNHQKHFAAANERPFVRLLRQYVDSASKSPAPKYWPLVEKVEVFVDSPILRNGIKLVDLPGTSDAFGFRGEIAHSYQDRLDKVIVVTPATRAADNKAAADFILSENQTMRLDMDGMLKNESICVVVTKIDSMNCDTADTEFPTPEIVEKVDALAEIEDALAEMEQSDNMIRDNEEDSENVPLAGRKRANADQTTCQAAKKQRLRPGITDTNDKQERMDELQQQRGFVRSELKYLCIQERNKELKRRIKETLLDPSKRISVAEESIVAVSSVYPVSSEAFVELQKTPSIDGFPDIKSTGIPDLKAWLNSVSLSYRQEWADADIHHIQVLIDAADGWTQANVNGLPKLSRREVGSLQIRLGGLMKNLGKSINASVRNKLQQKLSHLEPLRKSNLTRSSLKNNLGKTGKETKMAMDNLRRFLELWKAKNHWAGTRPSSKEEETHWSTYQACVRRHGAAFVSRARRTQPKTEIHWLGDVDLSFWRGHKDKWRNGFTQKFSTIKKAIHSSGLVAFERWVKSLHDDEGLPESFRELMKANTYKLDHLFDKYMTDVGEQTNQFEKAARWKRSVVKDHFYSGMRPGFEDAARIHGKKIKEKQSLIVEKHVEANGVQMFRNARNALETHLAELHKHTSKEVKLLWTAPKKGCRDRISAEMRRVLKRSSISPQISSSVTMMPNDAKAQIRTIVVRWRARWHAVHVRLPRFVPVKEEMDSNADEVDSNADEVDSENEEGDISTEVQVKREPDEFGNS
ncbi:hypothetical protein CTA1_5679 [Colletotrichum tanaceti]|uniref:Dynamin N-terminal domain-containing protein n=1 Tax=Colletotrichum tanaceti TaxID=1306861 RepID=A0A4U6X5D0_9PEZI|nr:hypothetical protein CTA1_5679 [Colletotrichum tanaceti]